MDRLDAAMVPIYRRKTFGQRILAGLAATELVRERLRAHLSHRHPEWSRERLERAVAERLLRSNDAN